MRENLSDYFDIPLAVKHLGDGGEKYRPDRIILIGWSTLFRGTPRSSMMPG